MIRTVITATISLFILGTSAFADSLTGNWKTGSGHVVTITGSDRFKVIVKDGKLVGRQIGEFTRDADGNYVGNITDPANNKTYSGTMKSLGDKLVMKGCVLGVFCRSETWARP